MKPRLITAVGRERMQKMIGYLRELPPERFDFTNVARTEHCGTVGCVIGHTPAVFPELCNYRRLDSSKFMDVETMHTNRFSDYTDVGADLFALDGDVAFALFTPGMQYRLVYRASVFIPNCKSDATPTEVADMLESFLAQVDDIPATEKARDAQ